MRDLFIFFVFLLLLIPSIAVAQDIKENSHLAYSPEFCEFSIAFPSEPYTTKRCDEDGKRCYNQVSYTKVFENLSSTVNFRVICNPIDESVISSYSGEVMEATLRAMTKRSVVKTFDTSFREEENFKQAGLVGEGKVGKLSTLYIAQLWIGQKSSFSVEAELIGEAAAEPDAMFSDILKSVGPKADEVKNAKPEEKN